MFWDDLTEIMSLVRFKNLFYLLTGEVEEETNNKGYFLWHLFFKLQEDFEV